MAQGNQEGARSLGEILKRFMPQHRERSSEENSLPDEPRCPKCEGRRWFTLDVPVGHELFGKIVPCRDCQVRPLETFESWEMVPGTEKAVEAARAFADGEGRPWVVLVGPVGTGKTHLASAAHARLYWDRNVSVRKVYVPDMMGYLRSSFDANARETIEEKISGYCSVEYLIMDDLCAERTTEWVIEQALRVLDFRYREHKKTLITTNVSIEAMARQMGARIASRVFDSHHSRVVLLDCIDYRTKRDW